MDRAVRQYDELDSGVLEKLKKNHRLTSEMYAVGCILHIALNLMNHRCNLKWNEKRLEMNDDDVGKYLL